MLHFKNCIYLYNQLYKAPSSGLIKSCSYKITHNTVSVSCTARIF